MKALNCFTDSDVTPYTPSERFREGTNPLLAEAHVTAWCYNSPGYEILKFLNRQSIEYY